MFGPYWWSSLVPPKMTKAGCLRTRDYGCIPATVNIYEPDGSSIIYRQTATTKAHYLYIASGSDSAGILRYTPMIAWQLTRDRSSYTYNDAGYLTDVTGPLGFRLRYVYDNAIPTQLIEVQNAGGKKVRFTWTGNLVTTVTDTAGAAWRYTYNAAGMLRHVTAPTTPPDIRDYHYDSADLGNFTDGVSINGIRQSTYTYNGSRKAIESALAGGRERNTLEYATGVTTVPDAAATGQSTSSRTSMAS